MKHEKELKSLPKDDFTKANKLFDMAKIYMMLIITLLSN
jgi:hypothetical protein